MTDYIDERTGFTVHVSQTLEELQATQAASQAAAQTEPPPTFGTVGQDQRGDNNADAITTAHLGNFAWFEAHRAEVMAAYARQELPGQNNHAAHPTDN